MGWVLKSDKYVCPLKKFTLLIALFHEKPTVLRWHRGQDGPKNVPLQTEGIVRGQQFWGNGGEMLLAQMLINVKMQSKCKIPDESKWESPRQVPLGLAPDRKGVQAFRFQGTHLKRVNYEMIDYRQKTFSITLDSSVTVVEESRQNEVPSNDIESIIRFVQCINLLPVVQFNTSCSVASRSLQTRTRKAERAFLGLSISSFILPSDQAVVEECLNCSGLLTNSASHETLPIGLSTFPPALTRPRSHWLVCCSSTVLSPS